MALELMQGNRDSSQVDLGYMELSRCCSDLRIPLDL